MSSIALARRLAAVQPAGQTAPEGDPFRYGWRPVERLLADGRTTYDIQPLSKEDLWHPQEGDQVAHSEAHQRRRRFLCGVFEAQLADDPSAVVLDSVRIAWDVPSLRPHSPDIAIVRGVQAVNDWTTFDVASEGVRPELIVEITSPETATIDRSYKLEEYDLAGVHTYIILDTVRRGQTSIRLLGYQRGPDGYQVMAPDEQGRLWIEMLAIWLGIQENEIACFNAAGQAIGNYRYLSAVLNTAGQMLSAASQGLSAATVGLGLATEGLSAALQARAEAEQRAEVAEARLADAEQRLRELEAELWLLRGVD